MTSHPFALDRRALLSGGAMLAATIPTLSRAATQDPWAGASWRKLSDAEWRARLPPASYDVLRREGTETPFTSPLNQEHRTGLFACRGCGLPLFKSQWKFDSGTGWPSFYETLPGAFIKKADFAIGYQRTEYHCARCLGHQGHVFNDGPRPTGLRYCNNGVALTFTPA